MASSANLPLQMRNDIIDKKILTLQQKLKDTEPIPDIYENKLKMLERLENKWDTAKTVNSIESNFSNNVRETKDPNICTYCAREVSDGQRVCSVCKELHLKEGIKRQVFYKPKKCKCGNFFTPTCGRQTECEKCKTEKEKLQMESDVIKDQEKSAGKCVCINCNKECCIAINKRHSQIKRS